MLDHKIIMAVVVVVIIVIIVLARSPRSSTSVAPFQVSQSYPPVLGTPVTYPAQIAVPDEGDIKKTLVSHEWNALITTFDVPGIITNYKQTSGTAIFNYDNGTDITMLLQWMTGSDSYLLDKWELNASLDGYSAYYRASNGEEYLVSITPHHDNSGRMNISIYGAENIIKRTVVIS
jgi:hypothetical protein